ncbi:hypothetical protein sce4685 [Sorangium cellulosum So ce56]|uniref:Anti-sigma factor n=1 Tax=Sorangium cellulosum (strain So ce56) TaxID=448385 RepID=A9FE43_SORC5|nr:hypothetical protein [Sorangium cellulosum]CAN94848.1 hypothetical protein sce4685 [Sorangium cellulosum So ce56]
MRDEELLEALGRAARERDPFVDPRWEALAEGKLSGQEAEAFRAEMQRSEEGRLAEEMLRPFDVEERRLKVRRLLAERRGKAGTVAAGAAVRRLPWRKAVPVAALAAAAALALLVLPRSPEPLPAYALLTSAERGDPAAGPAVHLRSGGSLTMTLRPEAAVSGPVILRAALVREQRAALWDLPAGAAQIAPTGAVKIAGTREALFPDGAIGVYEIVLAVGRPEALPEDADAIARAEPRDGVRVLRQQVILEPP